MEFWDGVAHTIQPLKKTKAILKSALQRNCRYPNQPLFGEFKEFDINQLYV